VSDPGARGVLLTGGLGVGKSAVAFETHAVLAEFGLPNAVLDLDFLAWATPDPASGATVDSLLESNLRALRPGFERAGVRYFVLARAVSRPAQVDAVRAAFGLPLAVVRITAPLEVAEARVRARDVGAEREENLAELGAHSAPAGEDFELENDGRPIRGVALELLQRLGWVTISA
jgi:hypothetical protein